MSDTSGASLIPEAGDALIVVDVQKDFLSGGSLAIPDGDQVVPVLNRYIDKDLAEIFLDDPGRYLKLGGETRQVTVLFADLCGFSEFAQARPADEVVTAINQVFAEITQLIFKHGGTFDKYLGDAIINWRNQERFAQPNSFEKHRSFGGYDILCTANVITA